MEVMAPLVVICADPIVRLSKPTAGMSNQSGMHCNVGVVLGHCGARKHIATHDEALLVDLKSRHSSRNPGQRAWPRIPDECDEHLPRRLELELDSATLRLLQSPSLSDSIGTPRQCHPDAITRL